MRQKEAVKSQPQTTKNKSQPTISPKTNNQSKQKLMQMLSNDSQVQIGSKVYQISPKNAPGAPKFFNSGYCISVGNLIVHSKTSKHPKSHTQQLSQTVFSKPERYSFKRTSLKEKAPQKNLANVIKMINSFVQMPKQKQSDELLYINSYLERTNNDINKQFVQFVESFDIIDRPDQKVVYGKSSEKSNLINVFKKMTEKDKKLTKRQNVLEYKSKRPPLLDHSSTAPKMNVLSYKNSLDQKYQRESMSSCSSAPQFNVLSYLNPNSSSTNIQQQRDLSSISNNLPTVKRLDDSLHKLMNRVKTVLDVFKAKEYMLKHERDSLQHEVEYWKAMYNSSSQ